VRLGVAEPVLVQVPADPVAEAFGARYCSSIRSTAAPFVYVRMSNIPAASSGERTGYSIERVLSSASTSNAIARARKYWLHRSQSGR
jgi:hypothetical protein